VTELADHVDGRLALGQLDLGFPELPNDLLRRVALSAHLSPSWLDPRNLAGSI
jgi:hypothetical protein